MSKPKVVITDYQYENVDQEAKILADAGAELIARHCKTEEEVIAAVRDADAVIVQYADINRRVLSAMTRCKMVVKYGIGVNNIDVDAASELGIYACNVPDYGIDEVSNMAIAFLMALSKKLNVLTAALKNGDWSYNSVVPLRRMEGSTLGLVGFGRIPQAVARKMSGFGLHILVYDPYLKPQVAADVGVTQVDFDTLCRESDYVSIHCPLTPETTHLFDGKTFGKMKNTALLINTARGPVVDEAALIAALKVGQIAGAGLDVFENEPLGKDSELLHMDNVLCTPHAAWYTEQAILAVQSKAAQEAARVVTGQKPLNAVNRARVEKQ